MASLMCFTKLDQPVQGYQTIINIMCTIRAGKCGLLEFGRYLGILDELAVLGKNRSSSLYSGKVRLKTSVSKNHS
jgi:hypothetical protein